MLWNVVLPLEKQDYFHLITEVKLLIIILKEGLYRVVTQCRSWEKMWVITEWGAEGEEDNRRKGLVVGGTLRKQNTHHSCLHWTCWEASKWRITTPKWETAPALAHLCFIGSCAKSNRKDFRPAKLPKMSWYLDSWQLSGQNHVICERARKNHLAWRVSGRPATF